LWERKRKRKRKQMVHERKEVVVELYKELLRGWLEQGAAERLGFET
jgi:hypothetical protein